MSDMQQWINDTRKMLDFLESTPGLPTPYVDTFDMFPEPEKIKDIARLLGTLEKVETNSFFILRRTFGTIRLEANFHHRQVCEAVVVGTEEIPEQIIEAHTRDIVEWKCPDALLRPDNRKGT